MPDKYYNGIYYDDNNKPYNYDTHGNKAYYGKENANLNPDGYYYDTDTGDLSGPVLRQDESVKKNHEKQMSIGDMREQDYAEKNRELKEQQSKEEQIKSIGSVKIYEGMKSFKTMLDKLKNKFCKNRAIYTMYVKMTLNNNKTVLVDSTSKDWDENCLVSFKYELNGSGEGNQFVLDLLFKPNDRSFKSIKTLEAKLLSNVGICEVDENNKENNEKLKSIDYLYNNCSFQYGYGDDISLRSPTYNGLITGYTSKIDNGNLRYTIKGIGGLNSLNETRISTKEEYLVDEKGNEITNPLAYIKNIVRIELEEKGLYTLKILDNIDPEKVVTIGDDYKQFNQKNIFQVINDILAQCISSDQYKVMTGEDATNSSSNTEQQEDKVEDQSTNSNNEESNQNNSNDDKPVKKSIMPTQKQLYGYFVEDVSTTISNDSSSNESKTNSDDNNQDNKPKSCKGTIYIYKIPSANGAENKEATENISADLNITFNWFGPGVDGDSSYTGIVKDWNPQYDGSTLYGLAVNLLSHDNSTVYYTMDYDGNLIQVQGLGAAREGTLDDSSKNAVASTIQEYSNWAFVTQYPYSANMTIIGCPCEIPMTGKIAVNALIGSEKHHTSGIYFVLKKTDTINSGGFWTELELFKIQRGYDPEYSEIKDDTSKTDNPTDKNKSDSEKQPITQDDAINNGLGPANPDAYYKDKDGNIHKKGEFEINSFDVSDFTFEKMNSLLTGQNNKEKYPTGPWRTK